MSSSYLCHRFGQHRTTAWVHAALLGAFVSVCPIAEAQIVPDSTLGDERSVVRRNLQVRGARGDRIDGGAIRGNHLFHSFSDFNVNELQRVYFSNPTVIDTIISRVTGSSQSDILGTLGVLGNADLFLINPNGIVFGSDAVLDVNGSFVASTAEHVLFDSGYAFSAADPNAPPLLNGNAPIAGLSSWLPQRGTIQTSGNLDVGGNLVLAAENLDVQGRLLAGESINFVATHQLSATDTVAVPLVVAAGQALVLQGNQSLELSALAHPDSGFTSGGNMVLRSHAPIVGDATFQAGGHLSIERLDGSPGSLISIGDPVFQTAGDFALGNYTGASLQILAGGSVTIPGEIRIESAGGPFNDSTVQLSDGRRLTLRGTTEPTVDIRAGTTQFFGSSISNGTPSSANITIGSISNPTGTVYLSNQFQPNASLTGEISVDRIDTADFNGGGDVVIDSRGSITFDSIDASGGDRDALFFDFDFSAIGGDGGDVTLLAGGDIFIPYPSILFSSGLQGGAITLDSDTAIIQENGPVGAVFEELSFIEAITADRGRGGDITLSAPSILIGGNVLSDTYGTGRSGNLVVTGDSLTTNQAAINTTTLGSGNAGTVRVNVDTLSVRNVSGLGSISSSLEGGNAGKVIVRANSVDVANESEISSSVVVLFAGDLVVGNGNDVTVIAQDITLSGVNSGIASSANPEVVEGNSGNIQIETDTLTITDGALVSTSSFTDGNAGNIRIDARSRIVLNGAVRVEDEAVSQPSGIQSELFTGASGRAGNITINTPVLELVDGGTITTLSDGDGPAGNIVIRATESVLVDGVVRFPQEGVGDRFSRISVLAESEATGDAGTLDIRSPSLVLANGGQLTAESRGTLAANAGGNIILSINDVISLTGGSRISATAGTSGAGGDGGNITIDTQFLVAEPNGNNDITANAFEGAGGSVRITADGIFGLTPLSRAELETLLGTTDPDLLDPARLPSSNITAISQVNPELEGTVVIESPDVDPSRNVAELPSGVFDATRLITQGCSATGTTLAQELGSLTVTGRGGLPLTPEESLNHQDLALEWEPLDQPEDMGDDEEIAVAPLSSHSQPPLVEVQALTRRADGQVILTAQVPRNAQNVYLNGVATCVSPIPQWNSMIQMP